MLGVSIVVGFGSSSSAGGVIALLAVAPFLVALSFGLLWFVQESARKEQEREANREYDAELFALQAEADRRLEAWQQALAKKQLEARMRYGEAFARWDVEVARLQQEARQRHNQEVAKWKLAHSAIAEEAERRKKAAQVARAQLEAVERDWKDAAAKFAGDFDAKKNYLRQLRDRHEELNRQYVKERQELHSRLRETQMKQFLQQTFISDYKIPDIGRGRLATLSSYGIETALDVVEADVRSVPGFGVVLTGRLLEWRRGVETRFVFTRPQVYPSSNNSFSTPSLPRNGSASR
jgi:hypothetical protein